MANDASIQAFWDAASIRREEYDSELKFWNAVAQRCGSNVAGGVQWYGQDAFGSRAKKATSLLADSSSPADAELLWQPDVNPGATLVRAHDQSTAVSLLETYLHATLVATSVRPVSEPQVSAASIAVLRSQFGLYFNESERPMSAACALLRKHVSWEHCKSRLLSGKDKRMWKCSYGPCMPTSRDCELDMEGDGDDVGVMMRCAACYGAVAVSGGLMKRDIRAIAVMEPSFIYSPAVLETALIGLAGSPDEHGAWLCLHYVP